jgi:hypothetical protein
MSKTSNVKEKRQLRVQRMVRRQFLNLTLHKVWFDKIASGEKTEEYRTQTPHWQKRLEGKFYEEIHFRNGYNKDAPQMRVECLGITTGEWECQPCYVLKLGKIIEVRRTQDAASTRARQTNRDPQAEPAIPHAKTDGEPQAIDPA